MVKIFENFDSYSNYYDEHEHEYNDVDIVENKFSICADGEFECKSWKTAIKRLAKATGWEWVLDELQSDYHFTEFLKDCDSVIVENLNDGIWYIAARQYK